jgi:hypothetical protein
MSDLTASSGMSTAETLVADSDKAS